jgi:hypothetical protein
MGFLFLMICFVFYSFFYSYHLFFTEQMQLFIITPEYFYGYFSKPAAIACYLGDFFTQFYYLKAGGAVVITITLSCIWILLKKLIKRFSDKKYISIIPILVVVVIAWMHTDLAYTLASTIALIIAVISGLLYTYIPKQFVRLIVGIVFLPVLYIIAGAYFYLFVFIAILFEILNSNKKYITAFVYALVLMFFSIFLPLFARSYYYLTKQQAYIYPNSTNIKAKPNFFLEKLLALDSEWYFNRPDKTLELAEKYKLKNPLASYYYNLALSKNNLLPEKLMEGYQPGVKGLFIPVDSEQNYISITFSNEIYYHLGDMNAAQHAVLLATIFSPKCQSSRLMRRLVEINIINGEYDVVEKYLKMLEHTLFHRKWAKDKRRFLYNEQECNKAKWIAEKRNQYPIIDLLKATNNDFVQTLKHLYLNHPENQYALDYLLCFYLLKKDINSFSKIIIDQYKNKRFESLPIIYQEALLIYFAQNPDNENRKLIRFAPGIYDKFANYNELYEKNNGNGGPLQKNYGKTYWFYYQYAAFKSKLENEKK